jgi:hypothetical protein
MPELLIRPTHGDHLVLEDLLAPSPLHEHRPIDRIALSAHDAARTYRTKPTCSEGSIHPSNGRWQHGEIVPVLYLADRPSAAHPGSLTACVFAAAWPQTGCTGMPAPSRPSRHRRAA